MYHLIVHARTTLSIWMLSRALALPASFKKKKTMRFCSLYHAFFFFWLMKLRDRLWTAECRFSIQTNNGADSVSVNGDQACLDEGFGGRRRALGLPLSLLICHSFFKQSAHLLRQTGGKDASSACCQNVIWAPDSAFPYQGHVWRLLHCVDLQKKRKETLTLTLPFHCSPFLSVFSLFYYSPSVSRRVLTFSFFPWTDALFLCHLNFLFLFWFWFFLLLSRSPSPLSSPPHILWSLFDEAPENRLLSHRGQAAQTAAVPSLLQRDPRVLTFEPSSMK